MGYLSHDAKKMYYIINNDYPRYYAMIMKPVSKWGYVSLAAAILVLVLLLYLSFSAVRGLADDLNKNHTADVSQGFDATLTYDDGLYAVVLYGQEILPADPDHEEHLEAFEQEALKKIDVRILSAGAVYALFIMCVLTYWIYTVCNNSTRKYVQFAFFFAFIVYIAYILFVWVFNAAIKIPFYFPAESILHVVLAGILPVIGGTCAAGILLRKIRFKKTAAVIIIPVIFALFLFSFALEFELFEEEKVRSFDYVADLDSRILDDEYADQAYYDEEKDVLIFDGKEYPPEMLDNPNHLFRAARAAAILYELAFPYSGCSLPLVEQETGVDIPFVTYLMYIIRSACWTLLPIYLEKNNNEQTEK